MTRNGRSVGIAIRMLLLMCVPLLGGCGGKAWFADCFKESNSLDADGENVSVKMFASYSDIDDYAVKHFPPNDVFKTYWDGLAPLPPSTLPTIGPSKGGERPLVLPLVATAAIGAA